MKKRVLMSLVLLAIIGTSAVFAQQPTLDKLKFVGDGKAGYMATPLNDNISGAVVIPATYSGLPVTVISGFHNCREITSVTIPAGTTIGQGVYFNAFLYCNKLTSVTFQGSDIKMANPDRSTIFPGDLRAKYETGGAGTYTRVAGNTNWTKGGKTVCPTCGGTGYI